MDGIIDGFKEYEKYGSEMRVLQLKQAADNITFIVNTVLGVVVWALMIGMVLVTAVDVAYITIPFFRSAVSNSHLHKRGKFRLVSYDAEKALELAELNGECSPLKQYLKLRIKAHIFTAVLLTVVLTGGWTIIRDFITPIIVDIVLAVIS